MRSLRRILGEQADLALVFGVVGILMVLFVPIPPGLLDFLLITNLSIALLVLLLTFHVDKPLQFSTFPSLLLIATLFRLSLNIAATRLILSDAHAGRVIEAIGTHVVSGNYVIGIIVFLVLVVVQYVVVTNGAQRVAEVAARFTLDAMPGKQMSIDADLNMGLIDAQQAQERRREIERETNFYGAMDGASKFVKGDAIAGIVIILINIIGGLTIGIAQHGMAWVEALRTFTLLTIGDGIVTQIPALVIATGTGIIVTRAASDAFLSREVSRQITAYPKVLGIVGVALLLALFLPGIPALPVLVLLGVVGALLYAAKAAPRAEPAAEAAGIAAEGSEDDLYESLMTDALEIRVGQNLIPLFGGDDSLMMDRVRAFRKKFALESGFIMPRLRARDDKKLGPHCYEVWIYGARIAASEVLTDRWLAIDAGNVKERMDGIETRDPTYGLPSVWIVDAQRDAAKEANYTVIEPMNVVMTHLSEIVRKQAPNLLTRSETERLVETVKKRNAGLVEELIPSVLSIGDVQKVLQRLLREAVSIRNLDAILEVLVDEGKQSKDPELLTEIVRQRLGATICQPLSVNGNLNVLVFDPKVERLIADGLRQDEKRQRLIMEPQQAEQILTRLAAQAERMAASRFTPVLLCAPELRRHIRRITERSLPQLSVLSMGEVPPTLNVQSYGMVAI